MGGFHLLSHLFLVWRVLSAEWAAAFPLPGSHPPSRGVRQFYLPKTPPRDPGRPQGLGHAWAQPGDSSCKAVNLGFKTHLFVCLFVAGQQRGWKKCQCHIVTYESPLSTGRDAPVLPPQAWGDQKRAEAPQKQLTPALCLSGPALTPSPCPQMGTLGTSVAWGHRWPRDNFLSPGKRGRNLHSYLHFLIAPAGFLGQRLALVSMAGFVQTWRTEGGTKRPQWSCHSPASKAAGGAGRGQCSLSSPAPGDPRARGRGWLVADVPGHPRFQRWGRAMLREQWSHHRCPEAAAAPRCRKWCKSWTQMFPLFSFPVVFSQLSIQLGALLSPSNSPLHSGTVLLAAVPIQLPCWPQGTAEQPEQRAGKPGPHTTAASPVPPSRGEAPANVPPPPWPW